MAYSDYRRCDVCGGKAFYDAELNYEASEEPTGLRNAGKEMYHTLEHTGDWVVLCRDCAKTHECIIRPRMEEAG